MDSEGVLVAVAEEGDVTPHEDEVKNTLLLLPLDWTLFSEKGNAAV